MILTLLLFPSTRSTAPPVILAITSSILPALALPSSTPSNQNLLLPFLHYLEDPFDAGDVYVPLLVRETIPLAPLVIVASRPAPSPRDLSPPPSSP